MAEKTDWYNTIRGQFGKDEPKSPEALAEELDLGLDLGGLK